MAERIFDVSALADEWGIPHDARVSITEGATADELRRRAMAGSAAVCDEVGLVGPRLAGVWSKLGAA
jgi:hypothetical protein